MTGQRPNKTAPPQMPTLRLDNQRAWRQGEDAVFVPIVYDLPQRKPANPDEMIVQIAAPLHRADPPSPLAEVLSREEKKKNLASLKKKAESGGFRAPKNARRNEAEVDPSFADAEPANSKYLSKSVPLLLLSVLALVFFAWMAFR